ncbi:hypothetical protein PBAL39_15149 [Pedobacter sp. BAL39]|uniref:hypothetical protein n=1 Tax=Pedobacter sp. BAL39 TaxID=391596 RepID=UPI0001559AAB|nr:hypothetical protein [Pedobacter sp. BAL39]EDM37773.1 hypothetical protein PBAL39_15149 [Pedobacter sp. BAL39]
MGKITNLIAGLAGAAALNILHESLKNKRSTPRIDFLGEQALQKTVRYFGGNITDTDDLYKATLAGDLISNTIYYSWIASAKRKNLWTKAVAMGLLAGVGAITLPEQMGLNPKSVAKTNEIKAMTVGYYVFGALVTALVSSAFKRK